MEKDKKKPQFIQQPEYPGGPKEMHNFIYRNLQYPVAALEARIEGIVMVEFGIDYKGNVIDAKVKQSLGYGCDEEACRVVKLLKFDVGKNRGVKVLFHRKANIQFKKPEQAIAPNSLQVQYTLTGNPLPEPEASKTEQPPVYTYTISF